MKIAILSDQHGSLPPIPKCDLMILSGDITGGARYGMRDGSDERWLRWLYTEFDVWKQQAPFTIAIGGNHDLCLERFGFSPRDRFALLEDSSVEFGGLKFWGAPWTTLWDDLAFKLPSERMKEKWDVIPVGVDVLVVHQPPFGYGDFTGRENAGCRHLTDAIKLVRPKLVTCGHIHEGRGIYDLYGTKVMNAACGFIEIEL